MIYLVWEYITQNTYKFLILSVNSEKSTLPRRFRYEVDNKRYDMPIYWACDPDLWSWILPSQGPALVDDVYEQFSETFLCLFQSCFPLTQHSRKWSKDKKWITPALKVIIKHKYRLYRKKLNNTTDSHILKYKQYKRQANVCLKGAMEMYFTKHLMRNQTQWYKWRSLWEIFLIWVEKQNHITSTKYYMKQGNTRQTAEGW